MYSRASLQSHLIQHHPLYKNTHFGKCVTGLCTKCTGYNNNLVIAARCSGINGVVVERFDCTAARCSGANGVVVERFDCTAARCSGANGVVVERFDCITYSVEFQVTNVRSHVILNTLHGL